MGIFLVTCMFVFLITVGVLVVPLSFAPNKTYRWVESVITDLLIARDVKEYIQRVNSIWLLYLNNWLQVIPEFLMPVDFTFK